MLSKSTFNFKTCLFVLTIIRIPPALIQKAWNIDLITCTIKSSVSHHKNYVTLPEKRDHLSLAFQPEMAFLLHPRIVTLRPINNASAVSIHCTTKCIMLHDLFIRILMHWLETGWIFTCIFLPTDFYISKDVHKYFNILKILAWFPYENVNKSIPNKWSLFLVEAHIRKKNMVVFVTFFRDVVCKLQ